MLSGLAAQNWGPRTVSQGLVESMRTCVSRVRRSCSGSDSGNRAICANAKQLDIARISSGINVAGVEGGRVLYIDGFAGRGRYDDGSEGSPQRAMRTLISHPILKQRTACEFLFMFIEKNAENAAAASRQALLDERRLDRDCTSGISAGARQHGHGRAADWIPAASARRGYRPAGRARLRCSSPGWRGLPANN